MIEKVNNFGYDYLTFKYIVYYIIFIVQMRTWLILYTDTHTYKVASNWIVKYSVYSTNIFEYILYIFIVCRPATCKSRLAGAD